MAQYIELPDGSALELKKGQSPVEGMTAARQLFPELFKPAEEGPKQDTSGLKAAASAGATRLGGQFELLKGKLGVTDTAEAERRFKAAEEKAAKRFTPTEDSFVESPFLNFKELLGGSLPSMALPAAAGLAALTAPVSVPVAAGLGLLGAGAVSTGQFTAANLGRQVETGKSLEDASLGKAFTAAVPQALLDTAAMALIPGVGKLFGSVGSKLTVEQAKAIANQTLGKAVLDYTAKTGAAMGREGLTETTQQVLERLQAGLELDSPEARKEYIDSFVGGAVLGGALAPVGRAFERGGAKSQAAKADREERLVASQEAAEQQRIVQEQEDAKKQTPEYALGVANQLKTLEEEKLGLRQQIRKISKDSPTEAEDKAFNKDINAQLKSNATARNELAPEINRLKQSGVYQQALEQVRVANLTPEEYLLENLTTVAAQPTYTDLELSQMPSLRYSDERKAAQEKEQEQARIAAIPSTYAEERITLAQRQLYDPSGNDYVDYLLQDISKAKLVVETKTPMPGLTASESTLIRNELAKQLKAMSKEELAARQAELQAQTMGKTAADPMADFITQSDALDVDRVQGVTDADIASTERAGNFRRDVITQGDLFGEQRVGQAAGVQDNRDVAQQLADLQQQLEIAYAQRNIRGGAQYREKINELTEQIRNIQERAALPTTGELGQKTTDIQEQLGRLPENLQAQRAAEAARQAALTKVANQDADAQTDLVAGLVDEIKVIRKDLRPETITQIEKEAQEILAPVLRSGNQQVVIDAATQQLEALSQKWRSGMERGETFTQEVTPKTVSADILRSQLDRAFAQRERYDPDTLSVLEQIADNLKSFAANPDRLNIASDWLNRATVAGRPSLEMTADVKRELAQLEEGKRSDTEIIQSDLPDRFLPKAVRGESATTVEGGKATFSAPGEFKTPEKKVTQFSTAAEFQKYLASDALKVLRKTLGINKDTAARTHTQIELFRKKVDNISKQLESLQARKKTLQDKRGGDANTAKSLLVTAEANLSKIYERLDLELLALQTEYLQVRQQFDFTAQVVEDIGQKIAVNLAAFQNLETAVVAAAQKTAETKMAYAIAIEQPVNKRTFSALRKVRREIISAIEQQIVASRRAGADETLLAFLNADRNLQLQLQAEEKTLDKDAQSLLNVGLALQEAATTQKRSRKNQKEIKQAQQELAAALDIKSSVAAEMLDTDTQLKKVTEDIAATEKTLARSEQVLTTRQTTQQRAAAAQQELEKKNEFVKKLESIKINPLSRAERDAKLAEDKKNIEAFQKSTAALAALPGQRIDFSKRQQMLELLRVSDKDSDRIASNIKDIEAGIEEMQMQVAAAEEMLVNEKTPERVTAINKKVADGNQRIAALKAALSNYQKAKERKLVEENKARILLSGDPEVTQDLDKRIDKLIANIQNQEALAQQTVSPKTKKPLSAETIKDRAKTLARYKRELEVLTGVRSNRLGIKRIDVTTGVPTKDLRIDKKTGKTISKAKQARLAEQEQFDAEIDRVQALGVEQDLLKKMNAKLTAMQAAKQPQGKAKQDERAEKIRALQEQTNKQQVKVDALTLRTKGTVSQAAREESSAPAKFRTGTAESKADTSTGTSKKSVVEERTIAQPKVSKVIDEANAFAARIAAARTDAQRTKLILDQDESTRTQISDALFDNVTRLQNSILQLEKEQQSISTATNMAIVERRNQIKRELTGNAVEAGDIETSGLYFKLRQAETQLANFGAALTEAEAVEDGTSIVGFDMGVADRGGFDAGFADDANDDFGSDALYRVSKTTGPSMSVEQVEAVYKKLTANWVNKPKVVVIPTEQGLPIRILKQAAKDKVLGTIPGLYDSESDTVFLVAANLRSVNDIIVTTVHEIAGHFGLQKVLGNTYTKTMNDIYNGNAAIRKVADARLKKIASLTKETAVEEALAEQAELDPNAPDTRSAMRKIYDVLKKWYQNTFRTKDTMTDAQVRQVVANARRFVIEGGEAGKGSAGITTPLYRSKQTAPANALEALALDITSQPKTLKEKVGSNIALQLEMGAVDMRAGLRETLRFGDDSLFTQAMYHVRKAEQKMAQMFTVMNSGPLVAYKDNKGFVGYRSSNENSARDVFDAIADIPVDDPQMKTNIAQAYMVAQRAENKGLSKLDLGELGITEEKLKAALAAANADPALKAALENVRRKYNAYNKGLIEFLASTGRITKKAAADLLKDGDYVPYYRVNGDNATLHFGNNITFNVGDIRRQPYLAELKGGQTKLLPLNEAIQQNTLLLTDMALTNNATKSVAYGLQALGKGAGPIDPTTGKASDRMVIKKGFGPDKAGTIRFYQEPDPNDSKDTGERHLLVDTKGTPAEGIPAAMVVQSLEGASLALPGFLKLGGVAADLLRAGVTRTPLYIARKLLREPMAAAFTGGLNSNVFSSVFKAGAEFVRMNRGTSDAQVKLIEKGLIQSGIFAGDMSDMKKMALQLASGKDQSALEKVLSAADRFAMRADAATLALVLQNAEANGLSEVEADMMTMESMNFYKRGLSPTVQYASRLIPFFNAQIQGLSVLVKAARGNMPFEEQQQIKRKFFNNAMLLMGMGLVYAMAMDDDETFRNARPRDKYSNFFLPIPGVEEPLKLPIPFEAGYFFSLAVAAVDGMRAETDGKAQFQALRDLFLSSVPGYSSMGVPQLVKPVFEVWTDKNFLTGGPIEPRRMQNFSTEERYLATTTDLAKQISKAVPILSPIQLEHIVRGYLGVLPLVAAAGANSLFEREGKGERPEGRASDLPLLGTAFQKKFGGGDADIVYRDAQEAIETGATLKKMLSEGRREEAIEYRDKNKAILAMAPAAGQYRQIIGRINADIRLTQERPNLTAEEKRLRLDVLDKAKQDRADAFIRQFRLVEERAEAGKI